MVAVTVDLRPGPGATAGVHPLDDPVGLALRGHHAAQAVSVGSALRYHPEVGPFAALAPDPGPGDWDDLARLLGSDGGAALMDPPPLPSGWRTLATYPVLQMVGPDGAAGPREGGPGEVGPEVTALHTEQDREDAQELVRRTEPGPFGPRTMELGRYLGVRDGGRLVAMAGERMRPPGWTEISAVCTDPEARGRGLAGALVTSLVQGIVARGDRPCLHVLETNPAARLYASLGFTVRRAFPVVVVRPPR